MNANEAKSTTQATKTFHEKNMEYIHGWIKWHAKEGYGGFIFQSNRVSRDVQNQLSSEGYTVDTYMNWFDEECRIIWDTSRPVKWAAGGSEGGY